MSKTKVAKQKVRGRNEDNSGDKKNKQFGRLLKELKELRGHVEMTAVTAKQMEALIRGIADIREELCDFRQEIKKELAGVKAEIKKEIDDQMQRVSGELRAQGAMITELQERVSEVEDWRAVVSEMVASQDERVKTLQSKIIDLQSRALRNQMRVFNCPEAATDGKSVAKFMEEMLWASLDLPDGTELNIKGAHRVPTSRPKDFTSPPRAIVVNFGQFDTKELVLRKAWETEVKVSGRRIGFDHDYPPEVVKMRRDYVPLKKILKQQGIGFSSPFTRLKIQWPEGTKIYTTAEEAAREMHAKGLKYKDRTPERTSTVDSTPRDEEPAEPGGETTGEITGDGAPEPVPEKTEDEEMEKERRRREAVAKWQRVLRKKTGENRGAKKEKEKRLEQAKK